jgi:ATP-dependent Lon protease
MPLPHVGLSRVSLKPPSPGGGWKKEKLEEDLLFALEGRRRLKQQRKLRGSFEFYKKSFSYIDQSTGTEPVVVLPEQGRTGLIRQDLLPPGSVYTASTDANGKLGLF